MISGATPTWRLGQAKNQTHDGHMPTAPLHSVGPAGRLEFLHGAS
jgi:hypothetical protein